LYLVLAAVAHSCDVIGEAQVVQSVTTDHNADVQESKCPGKYNFQKYVEE